MKTVIRKQLCECKQKAERCQGRQTDETIPILVTGGKAKA